MQSMATRRHLRSWFTDICRWFILWLSGKFAARSWPRKLPRRCLFFCSAKRLDWAGRRVFFRQAEECVDSVLKGVVVIGIDISIVSFSQRISALDDSGDWPSSGGNASMGGFCPVVSDSQLGIVANPGVGDADVR